MTSLATTAKPFPAAPARADSIVALRASMFVWSADPGDQLGDPGHLAKALGHRGRRAVAVHRLLVDLTSDLFGRLDPVVDAGGRGVHGLSLGQDLLQFLDHDLGGLVMATWARCRTCCPASRCWT